MSAQLPVGARRRLLTLEAPVDTSDDNGGASRAYAGIATLWARITPRNGAMIWRADQQAQSVTHEIAFRARSGLDGSMRLRDGDRVFQILALEDGDEKRVTVRALCEEIKP